MSSLVGTFLVARNSLRDPFFGCSVVLLLRHNANGAFGLVLNRLAEADDVPFPIFIGGPCQLEGLLMLHGHAEWLSEPDRQADEVCPGVFLGDADSFARLGDMPDGANWRFRVFTGYSGWGPRQLEAEMSEGAWIVRPADGERLFDTPVDELWDRLNPSTIRNPSLN